MVTRAQVRSGDLSEFEKALCRVIRSEVEIDGRSPEQIATIAGTGKSTLRRMMAGVVVMRVDNIQRVCQVLGVPFWAVLKAAESEEQQPTLQEASDDQLRLMLSAVKAERGNPRSMHGCINLASACLDTTEHGLWEDLVSRGYAVRGAQYYSMQQYQLTKTGCEAIRLSKAATVRAMEHLS
jgi:transcriptional regulator with XRE-family HTH domain